MSHKKAKANRKRVRTLVHDLQAMPMSITEGKYLGYLAGITAEGINQFKKARGFYPIPTQLYTKGCQKYFYKTL